MRIERKKNASRNIVYGFLTKIHNILLPFIMRSAMIHFLGVEYLGLSSLFTSILQVLNLAELGIGSAMVFSMYKPIAEDDNDTVCALMILYRRYYRIIGTVVLIAGLAILPAVPRLIHGSVPAELNVYILYLLNLFATVFSYWLFAYRNSILLAHQRNDVTSKISLCTNTIKYAIQLAVLAFIKDYYWYVIAIVATQIINNVATAYVSRRMYPQFEPRGKLDQKEIKAINSRVRDVFTAKLGGTILNSADTIIISAFLGLRLLAIYQNYYYVIDAVIGVFTIFFSSITAGVGNSLVIESKEKNYSDYKTLSAITFGLIGFSSACMVTLYQPFITLWVGKDLLLSMPMVFLFCLYFVIVEYVRLASVYKDAAGIWHQDRFRPLISGIANLVLNLLMVKRFGLTGILLSTILSAGAISVPWITMNLFRYVFEGQLADYLKLALRGLAVVCVSALLAHLAAGVIPFTGAIELALKLCLSTVVSILVFLAFFWNTEEYGRAKKMLFAIVKRRK